MRSKDFIEEEVLRKAITIFWEKGYNATSMQDLIDGLGIGRSSIYHAFGDKHSLFVRALEFYQADGTTRIRDVIENTPSVKDAVAQLLNTVVTDMLNDDLPKGCFKINTGVEVASQDDIVCKLVYDDDLLIEELLLNAFKRGQQQKEINDSKDPLALAHFFCNTIAGMRVYAKFKSEPEFFSDIIRTALSVLE